MAKPPLANAIKVTLGPKGRNVVIDKLDWEYAAAIVTTAIEAVACLAEPAEVLREPSAPR